ncbi:MAG: flagellar biosynthesis protein FlhB [Vampirovibrionales bacterium]
MMMMMSDTDGKDEKPTATRLAKARQEGNVWRSQDLVAALIMGGVFWVTLVMHDQWATQTTLGTLTMMQALTKVGQLASHGGLGSVAWVMWIRWTIEQTFQLLWIPLTLIATLGVLVNLVIIQPLFTLKPLMPSFSKLNPVEGFKRLFSPDGTKELLKGLGKSLLILVIVGAVMLQEWQRLLSIGVMSVPQALQVLGEVNKLMGERILYALLAIGLFDVWWQHRGYMKKLGMSIQDIKEEMKTQEGDQRMKHRIRTFGRGLLSKKRPLDQVKTADVIITNPTHFAVAIKYDPAIYPAPLVVAKGVDHMALKIREAGKAHHVTIIENPPLARALYRSVEVEQMIPEVFFTAIAEVLALVYRATGKQKAKTPS